VLSLLANLDIFYFAGGWLLVFAFSALALVAGAGLGEKRLLDGLYWAGWAWFFLWPLPRAWGWIDNRNLLSVWPVVSVLVILARGKRWWWVLPHLAVLLFLGSRGAILGLLLGLVAWFRPRLDWRQAALFTAVGLAFLWVLVVYRPQEALNRLSYWDQAVSALFDHNPWLGLGPGGVAARRAIIEPGSIPDSPQDYHSHAHNLFFQILAELGLAGLAALVIAIGWTWRMQVQGRWQLAIMAALLVHSLVDFPLYFPGPLAVFLAVMGTLQKRLPAPVPISQPGSAAAAPARNPVTMGRPHPK
jgi:O-antigen ligase